MSNGLMTPVNHALERVEFNAEQMQLITDVICKGASKAELAMFLEVCKGYGANPIKKHIHAVWRWDAKAGREVMGYVVGIDFFRLKAASTGQYEGTVGPFFCGPNGEWSDVWLSKEPPRASKVGIWRTGFREPVFSVALWDEYKQEFKSKRTGNMELGGLWAKMPTVMIAKCAEALALRKAFPDELGGLYTDAEMGQAGIKIVNPDENKESGPVAAGPVLDVPAEQGWSNPQAWSEEDKNKLEHLFSSFEGACHALGLEPKKVAMRLDKWEARANTEPAESLLAEIADSVFKAEQQVAANLAAQKQEVAQEPVDPTPAAEAPTPKPDGSETMTPAPATGTTATDDVPEDDESLRFRVANNWEKIKRLLVEVHKMTPTNAGTECKRFMKEALGNLDPKSPAYLSEIRKWQHSFIEQLEARKSAPAPEPAPAPGEDGLPWAE